jgi:hypothetical protein
MPPSEKQMLISRLPPASESPAVSAPRVISMQPGAPVGLRAKPRVTSRWTANAARSAN